MKKVNIKNIMKKKIVKKFVNFFCVKIIHPTRQIKYKVIIFAPSIK